MDSWPAIGVWIVEVLSWLVGLEMSRGVVIYSKLKHRRTSGHRDQMIFITNQIRNEDEVTDRSRQIFLT